MIQVNTKDVVDKRSSRKLKERDQQFSHVKKRKQISQQLQVLFRKIITSICNPGKIFTPSYRSTSGFITLFYPSISGRFYAIYMSQSGSHLFSTSILSVQLDYPIKSKLRLSVSQGLFWLRSFIP